MVDRFVEQVEQFWNKIFHVLRNTWLPQFIKHIIGKWVILILHLEDPLRYTSTLYKRLKKDLKNENTCKTNDFRLLTIKRKVLIRVIY